LLWFAIKLSETAVRKALIIAHYVHGFSVFLVCVPLFILSKESGDRLCAGIK